MIVTTVTIYVQEEHVQDFIDATIANHEGSIKEKGNCRFDFLRCKDDPARFLLYEVYESEEDIILHKKTEHYLQWREKVDGWMKKRREGVQHSIVRPLEKEKWLTEK